MSTPSSCAFRTVVNSLRSYMHNLSAQTTTCTMIPSLIMHLYDYINPSVNNITMCWLSRLLFAIVVRCQYRQRPGPYIIPALALQTTDQFESVVPQPK